MTQPRPTNGTLIVLALIAFVAWGPDPSAPEPGLPPEVPDGQVVGLGDAVIKLPSEQYGPIEHLLLTGKVLRDHWVLDFSSVQTITVSDGRMVFNPPATVTYDGPGRLDIGTTITEITARPADGLIFVDVDMSPIDLKVVPDDDDPKQ